VAAVGGAYILGVLAPVRAAEVVTYSVNGELDNGEVVYGSYAEDFSDPQESSGILTVVEGESVVETLYFNFSPDAFGQGVVYYDDANLQDQAVIVVDGQLNGDYGQTFDIIPGSSSFVQEGPDQQSTVYFENGTVTDEPSVPEPSSIMATVTAVTIGVVIRRLKRKI